MTISPLSIGALNNGWLVSLNLIIDGFNLDYPSHQIDAVPLGIINDGHVVATQWLIGQMNEKLDDAGEDTLAPLVGQTINNGWQYMLADVITKYNSGAVVPTDYSLTNLTYISNILHYTSGTLPVELGGVDGGYVEYASVASNKTITLTVPAHSGTSSQYVSIYLTSGSDVTDILSTLLASLTLTIASGSITVGHNLASPVTVVAGDILTVARVGDNLTYKVNSGSVVSNAPIAVGTATREYVTCFNATSGQPIPDLTITL